MIEASSNNQILEKTENQFTVVFNGKHFGYFNSRAGAEAFLECLIDGSGDDTMSHQEKRV
jgi:hypothetical protein